MGTGARRDAPDAPADDLLLARRGRAFVARVLNDLTDEQLDAPSAVPGQSRRYVIAHLCQQARAQALALKTLRAPLSADDLRSRIDVARAVTLPPHALRYLFQHAGIHLDVEWRDLPQGQWNRLVSMPEYCGPARNLPRRHAAALWQAASDLNTNAQVPELPAGLFPPPHGTR